MKSLILMAAIVAMTYQCGYAIPNVHPPLVCDGVTTSTTPVTATMTAATAAYIDALQVVVSPASTTCTVSIATAGLGGLSARTLYSSSTCNGTVLIRPVAQDSTNGVTVASFNKEFLAMDKLVVSAHTATTVTNITVTVVPVFESNP